MHWLISESKELNLVAEELVARFPNGGVLGFEGPLGVGKTTLIKQIVKTLCERNAEFMPRVTSPSFVVHQVYETRIPIHHFDFYRLDLRSSESLIEIGYWEAWELAQKQRAYVLIEWPSQAQTLELKLDAQIQLSFQEEKRQIQLKLLP